MGRQTERGTRQNIRRGRVRAETEGEGKRERGGRR